MAKIRKTAAISPEERLAQALVPAEQQPYPVPENWCWVYLGAIATVNPPKVPRTALPQQVSFVPMSAVSENTGAIEAAEIRRASDVASGYTCFQDNDIIFAKITPCMENGKCAIASNLKNGMAFGSTEFYVLRASCCLSKELLYHLLRSKWFRDEARENMSGAVGQQRVKKEFLLSYPFPLPPLAEQQRIVERIASLFAKLDEVKEKVQAVLDGFETRRAAILHQAFTGQLTAKWRRAHDVRMEDVKIQKLSSLCKSLTYGTAKKSKTNGAVIVVRMGNLQQGEIHWKNLVYSDDEDDIQKYLLMDGDVLFNRTNSPALVGKTSIYRGQYPAIYAGYLIKLDYGNQLIGRYLNYIMNTPDAKYYCYLVKSDGVNQSNISAKRIGEFKMPVPSIPEQTEIVRILDEFFAKEQQAKELCSVLENIDLIKKAILARAFRGQLGTNDPAEESAVELLKRVV